MVGYYDSLGEKYADAVRDMLVFDALTYNDHFAVCKYATMLNLCFFEKMCYHVYLGRVCYE